MTDITPSRINIQSEETAYKASVSEATLTRVGASTNFVNRYQFDSHAYNYNYLYKKFEGGRWSGRCIFLLVPCLSCWLRNVESRHWHEWIYYG